MNTHVYNTKYPIENLAIGTIIEVDGTHIIAEIDPQISDLSRMYAGNIYQIGQFGSIIRIHFGRKIIYGYVSRLRMKVEYERERGIPTGTSTNARVIEADLFGEGEWNCKTVENNSEWKLKFERGISTFPLPQQKVYLTPTSELAFVYGHGEGAAIEIGTHVGSGGTPCFADMNELLGKHTAILGSTGSGKSGTVAAIIHSILERKDTKNYEKWHPRIILLDPHNEYSTAFHGQCTRLSTDEGTLKLPYWLLSFEETADLIIGKTEFAASSQTTIIKNALRIAREEGAKILGLNSEEISIDSPVPYVLGDPKGLDEFGFINDARYEEGFVGAINKQRPPGKNKSQNEHHNKILRKLEALIRDSRINFMMVPWNGTTDSIGDTVDQFIGEGEPLRIVDLSGVPNEVAGAASSAIARMLFAIKLWQTSKEREKSPILLVCEEAHRYVPNRGEAIYGAAQDSIRRLAKEGRKYGIGLMLVSQRPSEVEGTVLSQCNSWIVLRITNDADRNHVNGILPDSLSGLSKMLSGLRRREAIFVGQATMLPSRIRVRSLSNEQLPRSQDIDFDKGWQHSVESIAQLTEIGNRWRYQKRHTDGGQ